MLRSIVVLSLLVSLCNADSNNTIEDESSYIDEMHKTLSETIIKWSDIIDLTVSDWLEDNETNITADNNETNTTSDNNETNTTTTAVTNVAASRTVVVSNVPVRKPTAVSNVPVSRATVVPNIPENTLEERVRSADAFFQNDKYLDDTDNAYVRVRVESYFESKGSNDLGLTLRAQMPFSRSKKNLKIFVENMTLDNANDILQDNVGNDREAPDIGIHYFKQENWIKSRYSIGLGGIDPFVKARYNIPIKTDKWLIDLVQLFKYSTDNKFEEDTNIYFDKEVGKKSLFRIQLYRKTQEDVAGMDYALFLQFYRSLGKYTGFGFGQSFIGNTKYQYAIDNSVAPSQTKKYSGINCYVTSLSWRKNIWRKWFYYEVRPSVSFDKDYDYEPNYRIQLFFDFYLGRFN